jgi:hypothetical protein
MNVFSYTHMMHEEREAYHFKEVLGEVELSASEQFSEMNIYVDSEISACNKLLSTNGESSQVRNELFSECRKYKEIQMTLSESKKETTMWKSEAGDLRAALASGMPMTGGNKSQDR